MPAITMFTTDIIPVVSSSISSDSSPITSDKPVIKPAVQRLLNNFEILYKTKFQDLVLASWVEVLNPIPDDELISTGIRVAQAHKYLPTPMEFLEVYRDGLRAKRETQLAMERARVLGDSTVVNKPRTEEDEKEYLIARLAIALDIGKQEDEQMGKVSWKEFDINRHEQDFKDFFASMRNMSLDHLRDLNMQERIASKKDVLGNISSLLKTI